MEHYWNGDDKIIVKSFKKSLIIFYIILILFCSIGFISASENISSNCSLEHVNVNNIHTINVDNNIESTLENNLESDNVSKNISTSLNKTQNKTLIIHKSN